MSPRAIHIGHHLLCKFCETMKSRKFLCWYLNLFYHQFSFSSSRCLGACNMFHCFPLQKSMYIQALGCYVQHSRQGKGSIFDAVRAQQYKQTISNKVAYFLQWQQLLARKRFCTILSVQLVSKSDRPRDLRKTLIFLQLDHAAWYSDFQTVLLYANNIVLYAFTG